MTLQVRQTTAWVELLHAPERLRLMAQRLALAWAGGARIGDADEDRDLRQMNRP